MALNNPFAGANAKLRRAQKHIADLTSAELAYDRSQPASFHVAKMENGDHLAYAEYHKLPGEDVCTITADTLGNLRAALDIATVQACILRGQNDKNLLKSTYFAVAGSESDWWGNVPRRMAGADKEIQSCVASFKPWRDDGNTLLYALTKAAASDKHVELTPVCTNGGVGFVQNVHLSRDDGQDVIIQYNAWNFTNPNRIALFSVKSPAKIEFRGPVTLKSSLGFGDIYALRNAPTIPTLNKMSVMCEQIIGTLEATARN